MSEHEDLEMSVPAWVLGALDADEADAVRLHVEGCAACRETAGRLRRVVSALPLEVDEVTPPPRLRERVLAAAAASRQPTVVPLRTKVRVSRRSRPPVAVIRFGRMPSVVLAAALVLALLVGLVAGDIIGRYTAPTPASQVARFSLAGHADLAGATASVIELKNDGLTLVDFNGLPPLETGRVYELWLITPGGRPDAAAVFVPDSNGGKVVLVNRSLSGYSLMAVTNEKGPDGATAPTQQPQLYGNIA